MFKSIRNQWQAHPLGITLLLLGYVIGILIVSIGTSVVQEARTYSLDSTSGNPAQEMYVDLSDMGKQLPTVHQLLPIFLESSQQAEIEVGMRGNLEKNNQKFSATLVGAAYQQTPDWQVPLINGRHLTANESLSNSHLLVIGKNIAQQFFPDGIDQTSTLQISGETFQVIGVAGIAQRATQWDTNIYLPLQATPTQIQNSPQQQLTVLLSTNNTPPAQVATQMKNEFLKQNAAIQVTFAPINTGTGTTSGQVWNSLIATALLAGLILLVSCVNITNLSLFWILDRRKEIGIRKAVGATDRAIQRLVVAEMMSIAFVAMLIALLLHAVLLSVLQKYGLTTGIEWMNLLFAFLVAVLCGGITSLAPVKAALKMEPIDVLRID